MKKPTALAAVALSILAFLFGEATGAPKCTAAQGQLYINQGSYERAIREFSCVIQAQPTEVEGYRGRIEAELLLGRYSDALTDHGRITAFVLPVHPDAKAQMIESYADRLAAAPQDIRALTGGSFAQWTSFEYVKAIQLLNKLLAVQPQSVFGNLFRGSSRLLNGSNPAHGVADLDQAIALAPHSADVRFIVADAYTYGLHDPQRAFDEASRALDWGLDTPRVHAILAVSYGAFDDPLAAAAEIKTHIEQVTTELVTTAPLDPGASLSLALVAGRVFAIPVVLTAGQPVSIATSSPDPDLWDTIAVLLAADGTPVIGSDDANDYWAAFQWVAPTAGTYRLWVTSFESVTNGELLVTRD